MIRLTKSEILKRLMRQDDPADLAISTWDLARKAIKGGNIGEALEFLEYGRFESKAMHDASVTVINDALTFIAERFGEEEVEKFWRDSFAPRVKTRLQNFPTVEGLMQSFAENHRGHGAELDIIEERDRFVVKLDPCGSEGMLRRTRSVGVTKKAYPWTWSKPCIPYYCTHCCIAWEIIAIEAQGFPVSVHEININPADPCIHYFYKKPELIPDEYFTRIGKKKTIR